MELDPRKNILKLHPNTIQDVRKLYGLDKLGKMDEAIDILQDWVKKQNHFTKKEFPRPYLENMIISSKGSIERVKQKLDKICTLRTLMPNCFDCIDPNTYFETTLKSLVTAIPIPKLTADHYRVVVIKFVGNEYFKITPYVEYYKFLLLFCEYMKAHDYAAGYIVVIDYRDINLLEVLARINVLELQQYLRIFMEGYGMRINQIHLLTESKFIDGVVKILKQILSHKMGNRIFVHKYQESLLKFIPKNILPEELGGVHGSTKDIQEEWLQLLKAKENIEYINEMRQAYVKEECRQTIKDEYMSGTFRALSID